MIVSMTGYGQALSELNGVRIQVEVRSLNSKGLDLNMRIPQMYRSKESDIRQRVGQVLERGKVDLSISREVLDAAQGGLLNKPLLTAYLRELKAVAAAQGVEGDLISAVMRLPDVVASGREELDEAEWDWAFGLVDRALEQLHQHRLREGKALEADLLERVGHIGTKQALLAPFEDERIGGLRERFQRQLDKLEVAHDANRLEQEIIFYLEKLDITEEQVRLGHHLEYFREVAHGPEKAGRKLAFIAQEIGREINTIGSKSNHSGMQRLVVEMKDELEKIKEQINNVL